MYFLRATYEAILEHKEVKFEDVDVKMRRIGGKKSVTFCKGTGIVQISPEHG